jgi:hypothetical protein
MSAPEMEAAAARVKALAGDGRHEQFKSTTNFEGPYHKTQHGFELAAG